MKAPLRTATPARVKVLIVDDSALVRAVLADIVNRQPDMVAVGAARDPIVARDMIRTLAPDVLTLDVEMPRMDGLEFLERLMRAHPLPVLMLSSLTERGAEVTLRALELGAVDFVAKPKLGVENGLLRLAEEIVAKIRLAAQSRPRPRPAAPRAPLAPAGLGRAGSERLGFIGASTGGTEAIRAVLEPLPPDTPAILVTQHMPPGFTRSFAERLDGLCRIRVKEAEDGERVLPGHAYLAPGGRHLAVRRSGAHYHAMLSEDAPVNRHRPSVEVLFRSAAQCVGANAVGIMLTGMGRDGAAAMLEMRRAGAYTIAQDEASSVVFGMPREAIALGAVEEVLPLEAIAPRLLERLRAGSEARSSA